MSAETRFSVAKSSNAQLRILGKTYRLVEVEDLNDFGLCDDNKQTISLRKGMPPEVWADTILHECVHAIDFQMHLKMTERQVHCVGSGLWALFADNPDLIQRIREAAMKKG